MQPLSEAIFTKSSRTKFAKLSQVHSTLEGSVRAGGEGETGILSATPIPLPCCTYTLPYTCTVHELCSRTIGEYRLRNTRTAVEVQTASNSRLLASNSSQEQTPNTTINLCQGPVRRWKPVYYSSIKGTLLLESASVDVLFKKC
jgi:hypothetical protein